jgi:hypothetical protein
MWVTIDKRMAEITGAEVGATYKKYVEGIALGRAQTPEDVAAFVSYLAGPDSDYMTGQAPIFDGGLVYPERDSGNARIVEVDGILDEPGSKRAGVEIKVPTGGPRDRGYGWMRSDSFRRDPEDRAVGVVADQKRAVLRNG